MDVTTKIPGQQFRGKAVKRMHVMVKPTGSLCNLDCTYCYYLSKQELLGRPEQWRMSDEVLESFIRQYFECQNSKEVVFSWQGGEPTLLGIDFFRKVVELEKKYCPPHVRCENDLQTNGTNLDDTWCQFLRDENFLVDCPSTARSTCMMHIAGTRADKAASTGCSGQHSCSRSTRSTWRHSAA